jgi:YD repeat-containing protein
MGRGFPLFSVLLNLAVASAAEPTGTSAPAKSVSRWAEIDAATGAMALDGTLRLSFPLGTAPELKALGLVAELRHGVETDAQGRARSAWQFRGLQSSLVPVGRERLRWRAFSGESVEFERAKIGRAFSGAGDARWLIREVGAAGHEIRAGDGRTWRFQAGLPVGVEDPALGAFIIVSQGALVRELRAVDALQDAVAPLCATYDAAGRLLALTVGAAAEQHFAWDAAGQLTSWQRADGQTVDTTKDPREAYGVLRSGQRGSTVSLTVANDTGATRTVNTVLDRFPAQDFGRGGFGGPGGFGGRRGR